MGATGGLLVLYLGGRWLGEERVRYAVKRFGRMVFLYERDFENVRRWFRRHGDKAVFFSHLVPTFSGPVAVLAGVHRMRPFWFLVYSAAGSAIWAALLVGLGWGLGESWRLVQEYAQPLGYIGLVVLAGVVVWLVRRRVVRGATARGEV